MLVVADSADSAGRTVVFTATALDNGLFDGVKLVTLSCSAPGYRRGRNVTVLDNEFICDFAAVSESKQFGSVRRYDFARDINDGPHLVQWPIDLAGIAGGIIVQPTNVCSAAGSGQVM
jgi:hypothetical protein